MTLIQDVLAVEAVRHVHVWDGANGRQALVATRDTEYDCRETGAGWDVNDDAGRNFTGPTLPAAIRAALAGVTT